jgi:hypothetical protein
MLNIIVKQDPEKQEPHHVTALTPAPHFFHNFEKVSNISRKKPHCSCCQNRIKMYQFFNFALLKLNDWGRSQHLIFFSYRSRIKYMRWFLALYHIQIRSYVKGPCHEIFDLWFFSSNNPIWAPDSQVKAFSSTGKASNSRTDEPIYRYDTAVPEGIEFERSWLPLK